MNDSEPLNSSAPRLMSRADAVSMGVFMIAGIAIAAWTLIAATLRIIEVLGGGALRVYAEFAGTPAEAPIGPGGAARTIELDSGWLLTSELPAASVAALVIEQAMLAATVLTVVGCLLALTWNILCGRMFSRANTRLVTIAGLTGIAGMFIVPFFANMAANGAFATVSNREFDNVILSMDLFPFILLAFIAALASTVFGIGDRLQRETEGLI